MDGWGVAAIIALMFASFVIGVVIVARRGVTVNVTQANNNSAGAGAPAGQRAGAGSGVDGFRLMMKAIAFLALIAMAAMVVSRLDAMLNTSAVPATVPAEAPAAVPADMPVAVPSDVPAAALAEAPAVADYVFPLIAGAVAGVLMLVGFAVIHHTHTRPAGQESPAEKWARYQRESDELYGSRCAEAYAGFSSADDARRYQAWRAQQYRREMQAINDLNAERPIPIESVSLFDFDEARRNRS